VSGAVTEQLSEGLFVVADTVFLDRGNDVCGGKAGERRFCEVRIFGEEVFRAAVDVGEVAAASS